MDSNYESALFLIKGEFSSLLAVPKLFSICLYDNGTLFNICLEIIFIEFLNITLTSYKNIVSLLLLVLVNIHIIE